MLLIFTFITQQQKLLLKNEIEETKYSHKMLTSNKMYITTHEIMEVLRIIQTHTPEMSYSSRRNLFHADFMCKEAIRKKFI
jgi:hypothetical protein